MSGISSRERVQIALSHREADRIPRAESFWPETIPLWRNQGLPVGVDVGRLFDFDIIGAGWIHHEARPGYLEIIDESPEWQLRRDGNGAILRYWREKSGTPEHVAFTIDSPDRWRDLKREMLRWPVECRVDVYSAISAMNRARAEGRWFCWHGVECFEIAKDVLGHEILCIAMAEEPDWVRDVFETHTEIALRSLEHLEAAGVRFDGGWIYGDIAFNHGPFCSPKMYRELVMPSHLRLVSWFKDRDLPVIYHTDGDFRPLIPSFLEIGIDCFQPLEAKAGMDVRELKQSVGDQATLMGNIDIMVLISNDRQQIEQEVTAKINLAKRGGGYIYHSDHSVPPGVTWATYQFLMELVEQCGNYA